MSPEEEKELKAANEWCWKTGDTDVLEDEDTSTAGSGLAAAIAQAAAGGEGAAEAK